MENIIVSREDLQEVVQSIKITFVISSLIAAFNSLLIAGTTFITQFLAAQSIGLTIVSIYGIANILYPPLMKKFIYQYYFLPFPVLIAALIGMNFLHEYSTFLQLYTLILIVSLPALLVFHYRNTNKTAAASLKEEKQKRDISEKQLLESKLLLLQAQINPHFLFNTLANIDAYIDYSPEQAKMLLQNYTNFLRQSLRTTQSMQGTLVDEINLINAYMSIQQTRFPQIQFFADIEENLLNSPVPPLLIQPLIENAIIHGLAPKGNQGLITLEIKKINQHIIINVSDNGVGLSSDKSTNNGIALENIKERLRLYQGKASFTLTQSPSGGVNAQLKLPQ
ncbi:sensor histidine kinase [Psychromonas aquimarina]|uniref:sensor histidine kinase n=1 Tax=Psychromonas aquimarina TaxID=444919 RepID=UPI0004112779|nr:histidine kinase [Psychromonas aquimarina]